MICQLISIILMLALLCGIFYALWQAVLQIPQAPFTWIARLIFWVVVAGVLLELFQNGSFASTHLLHLVC